MPKQDDLGRESGFQQSRISMFETPGAANITLETLARIAAGLRVGVVVKFVPFQDMLAWENSFSPNDFDVTRLAEDYKFLDPATAASQGSDALIGSSCTAAYNASASAASCTNAGGALRKSVENEEAAVALIPRLEMRG